MRVVAVVPAFEAGRTVGDVVRGLAPHFEQGVIVVDDGSRDDTGARAADAGALVLVHPENRGKGAALRTGLERAEALGADVAVSVDADGQHPPEEALRLAEHPAPSSALVLGVRNLAGAGAPRANRISNGISNFFLSGFTRRRLSDTQCGLRRYPVAATLALGVAGEGYAFEAEAVLRAARAGWEIVEVPVRVVYPPADQRVSHFHVVKDPARIVVRVLATMLSPRARR
jgi:glycosyltransferase involved in cell wall biosynthesis